MTNEAMPGLLKIGITSRDPHKRIHELSSPTGVPCKFELVHIVFSENPQELESKVHESLDQHRYNSKREFFTCSFEFAVSTIEYLLKSAKQDPYLHYYNAISIFQRLQKKHANFLKKDLIDIRIVQSEERVWIETTQETIIGDYLKDQTIKRTDLGFCSGSNHDNLFFSPYISISKNAEKFVNEWDEYSIINTTDLFHEEACEYVNEHLNPHNKF